MDVSDSGDTAVDPPFDHPPAGHTRIGRPRLVALDVTRAIALVGVIALNYHGYLNDHSDIDASGQVVERSFAESLFHPFQGVLSTRFAATFVLVAGMGVTLLTARARASGVGIADDRWRLVRRGMVLYAVGYALDWSWPGTILFFYGAYFMLAAGLFTLRSRALVAIALASTVAAAAISQWRFAHALDGHDTSWLDPNPDSLWHLVLATFVGGTHPVLPWLAFLCLGMVIGRALDQLPQIRARVIAIGIALVAGTYAVNALGPATPSGWGRIPVGSTRADAMIGHLLSTRPGDHGVLYTVGTVGTAIVAFGVISWFAERFSTSAVVVVLRRAGQLSLTLYLVHIAAFLLMVDALGIVGATGLDTALTFALVVWLLALAAGSWYQRLYGQGPFERLYRRFGG